MTYIVRKRFGRQNYLYIYRYEKGKAKFVEYIGRETPETMQLAQKKSNEYNSA